jgi:uncharacterized protein involved in cysteine biosynthesis
MSRKKANKLWYLTALIPLGLGALFFWAVFFKLTPWICCLLPQANDWTPFLKVIVYIVVAWCGGLIIPFIFVILGIIWLIQLFDFVG